MLLKALQYFWVKSWDIHRQDSITYITGETYWIYRLYAEGLFFGLVCLGFSGAAFYDSVSVNAMSGFLVAGLVSAIGGLLEMLRLTQQLREQVTFAELFYND